MHRLHCPKNLPLKFKEPASRLKVGVGTGGTRDESKVLVCVVILFFGHPIHERFIQILETPPIAPDALDFETPPIAPGNLNFEMDIDIDPDSELALMPGALDDPKFTDNSSVNLIFKFHS